MRMVGSKIDIQIGITENNNQDQLQSSSSTYMLQFN